MSFTGSLTAMLKKKKKKGENHNFIPQLTVVTAIGAELQHWVADSPFQADIFHTTC